MRLIFITLLLANLLLLGWYQYPFILDFLTRSGMPLAVSSPDKGDPLELNKEPANPNIAQLVLLRERDQQVGQLANIPTKSAPQKPEQDTVSLDTSDPLDQTELLLADAAVTLSEGEGDLTQVAAPNSESNESKPGDQDNNNVLANLANKAVTQEPGLAKKQCVAYGPFLEQQLALNLLERAQALESISRIEPRQENLGASSYWVYFPTFPSRQAALAKLRALKQQKIDSFIFTDGALAGGISVGLFSNIERAQSKQATMKKLGHQVDISELERIQETYWLIAEEGTPVFSWLSEKQAKKLAKESAKCIAQKI